MLVLAVVVKQATHVDTLYIVVAGFVIFAGYALPEELLQLKD